MPNWKTHLEIAKKLNEQFKYKQKEYEMFLVGNILPDINNGYIVENISTRLGHDITHLGNYKNFSHTNFLDKYRKEIENNNPLFVGYLVHLYTDCTWNQNFYKSIQNRDDIDKVNREALRIMKQSDFKVYNNKFSQNTIDTDNIDEILNEIEKIEEVSVNKEDIEKAISFLKNQKIYEEKLQFYTMEKLDQLFEDTVEGYKNIN